VSLDAALEAAKRGWAVFPVDHPDLPQCAGIGVGHDQATCTERGKHPAVKWGMAATTDPQVIAAEWSGRLRNVGIACGPSKLVVIDEDKPGEFERWATDHGHTIPATFTVTTAHGRHWYFWAPAGVPIGNRDGMFTGYAINVRGGPTRTSKFGGYVVGAGSTHQTGAVYTADSNLDPAPMPAWLTEALTGSGEPFTTITGSFELPEVITCSAIHGPPNRDDVLYRYACSLQGRGVPKIEALASMQHVAFPRVEQPDGHPYPLAKALSKVENAYGQFGDDYTPNGAAEPGGAAKRRMVLTSAADIKPRPVYWLWEGRLALGTLGLLAGREGLGKSTIGYWLAARITRGELPGEYHGHPKAVLVCATEDSWEHTIVPRLMAAGADLNLVHRVEIITADEIHAGLLLPHDNRAVERNAIEFEAGLLLLDPLMSRLAGELDTYRDGDVRQALEPLVAIADRTGMAVLGVMHHNKSESTDPLQLVMASRAFTAVARSVHTVIKDPDDETGGRRRFGSPKNNLGRSDLPTLAFTIVSHPIDTDDGTAFTGRIEWGAEVADSIDEIMRRAGDDSDIRTAVGEAVDWLTDYLETQGGEAASADIKKAGHQEGHTQDALQRARKKLKLQVKSRDMPRRTFWITPEETQSSDSPRGEPTTQTTQTTAQTGHVQPVLLSESSESSDTTREDPTTGPTCRTCHRPQPQWVLDERDGQCIVCYREATA
jgi:hypothetical protein